MNRVDELLQEAESEHVAYTEFMTNYKKSDNKLHCFFEGDDDIKYYRIRIESQTQRMIKGYTCNGVDKLKAIKKLIDDKLEYKDAKALYFIDKDYTTQVTNTNVYVTPFYSVENFYTNEYTLSKILTDELKIKDGTSDYNICITLFSDLHKLFHDKLLTFNAWLACQSYLRKQEGISTRLEIDKKVNKYFDDKNIVHSDLSKIYNFEDLNDINTIENTLFIDARKISALILEEKKDFFKTQIPREVFRGKFELKFFISFIKKLLNNIGNKTQTILSKKYSYTLQINHEHVISILSQYAYTPECLPIFLSRYTR